YEHWAGVARHSYLAGPPCRWTVRDNSSSAAAQCSVGHPLVLHQWSHDAAPHDAAPQDAVGCWLVDDSQSSSDTEVSSSTAVSDPLAPAQPCQCPCIVKNDPPPIKYLVQSVFVEPVNWNCALYNKAGLRSALICCGLARRLNGIWLDPTLRPVGSVLWAASCGQRPVGSVLWAASCATDEGPKVDKHCTVQQQNCYHLCLYIYKTLGSGNGALCFLASNRRPFGDVGSAAESGGLVYCTGYPSTKMLLNGLLHPSSSEESVKGKIQRKPFNVSPYEITAPGLFKGIFRAAREKEKVSGMLSALIVPFKYMSPGPGSTEDEDTLSTSSAEVKENRNFGNLEDCTIVPSDRQPLFLSESSRSSTSSLKRKRPLEEDNNGRPCRLRLCYRKLPWSDAPKNALVQLNELRPGLQYRTVSQTGPVHAPLFSIAVEVNGLTFEGTGPTKKKAKMRAAELALRSFVQFPNASQAHLAMGGLSDPSADFTSDQADFPETLFKGFEPDGCRSAESELLSSALRLRHTLDLMVVQARQGNPAPETPPPSPVVLLNDLRPGLRYACLSQSNQGRGRSFIMAVRVDGRIFEGSGRSKKLAKRRAALSALQALFNIRQTPEARAALRPSRIKCPHLPQVSCAKPSPSLAAGSRNTPYGGP
ncbi:hypothetical protein NFI96_000087, partial [Prochilodus magdalenae]